MYINRRILLVVILFAVSTVLVPMSAQGQAPDPAVGEFLEAKIQEPTQFMRAFDVSPTSVTASSGLQRWYVQPAITKSDVRYPSLVSDAGDTLHLAYYDHPVSSLGYAKYDGSVWHIQSVDTVSTFNPSPQLAVDTVGRPHIIYCDGSAYDCVSLKYAYYDGSVWQVKTVAGTGTVYSKSNLEVDSNKHLHFSYIDIDSHTLKYARYDGSIWHIETVGSAQPGGTLIALDSADLPHIVYANNNSTMHTYYDGMTWQVEVLDSPGALTKQYASIALDSVDQLHIAYYNQNSELIYAYYATGTWYSQTVTQVGFDTTPLILKLDRADQPHILYRRLGSSWTDLFYIHRENSTWQFEIVASNTGYYALAIDNEDRPNIVYGIGALYYARRADDPSSWSAFAFASYRDMNFEVYTADGDGSNPVRRTVHGATDYTPEYNYGATKLVFVSNRDGNLEIYTMNADGTNLARLTANGAGDYLPTWSPDSSKIAFYSLRSTFVQIWT